MQVSGDLSGVDVFGCQRQTSMRGMCEDSDLFSNMHGCGIAYLYIYVSKINKIHNHTYVYIYIHISICIYMRWVYGFIAGSVGVEIHKVSW